MAAVPTSPESDTEPISFFDLPAAIRVRIYGLVFSNNPKNKRLLEAVRGTVPKRAQREAKEAGNSSPPLIRHCCCFPYGEVYDQDIAPEPAPWDPFVCPCTLPRGDLLYVNKIINKEATPIYYKSLEVRICLPTFSLIELEHKVLDPILSVLPQQHLKHIRKILLVQSGCSPGVQAMQDQVIFRVPDCWWERLVKVMPKIRDVRLHLHVGDVDSFVNYSKFTDTIAKLADLLHARSIGIEVARGPSIGQSYLDDLGEEIVVRSCQLSDPGTPDEVEEVAVDPKNAAKKTKAKTKKPQRKIQAAKTTKKNSKTGELDIDSQRAISIVDGSWRMKQME